MTKIWLLDFNGQDAWLKVLIGAGAAASSSADFVNGVAKFVWHGPDIEITTFSDPIQGIYEKNVLPPGFGHVSYVGLEGTAEKIDVVLGLVKEHCKPVLS